MLLLLGSRRTSGTGTDFLYPHHLRLRPRLTRISNSPRRPRSLLPFPSNHININKDTRRPRFSGHRLCQYCHLAMALIPAGNAASEAASWPCCLISDGGILASVLLC